MRAAQRIAALDIGGTKIKACVFEGGTPSQKSECDTAANEGAAAVLARAAALIRTFGPFDAIGVSTAGQVDPNNGVIRYANENLPGYTGMDVKGYFEAQFQRPAAVLNDVCAAALGEGTRGAAAGVRDYICLTYGTGIGGGVVLDGQLYYGTGPSAGGMLGGLILHPEDLDPQDPFAGTYERYASATALRTAASGLDPALTNGHAIFQRLDEPEVRTVVDAWLDQVAAGAVSLIHVFNIPCVVLGGGVMEQPYAIQGAQARIEKLLIPGCRGVRVGGAALGNMAGRYGAAQQVCKTEFGVDLE